MDYFNEKMLKELEYYSSVKNNSRNSARILDKFPLTYKRISHMELEVVKKHYLLFPTSERKPVSGEEEKNREHRIYQAICTDISGSGTKIITPEKLSEEDFIEMILAPQMAGDPFTVQAAGRVRRVSTIDTGTGISYRAGISFLAIHETDREKITHYTFEIQRRLLSMRRQIRDDI